MQEIKLNKGQQAVFDRVVKDRAKITYLAAEPGFGKTYVTAEIIKHSMNVEVTATTHKAKSVLSKLLGRPTTTIHKYMRYTIANVNYKQQLVKVKGEIEPCSLLVCDEIGMIPNRILKDILYEVEKGELFEQVLFVGDPLQLPAVADKPNLKLLEPYRVGLTEQMRQSGCSILSNYLSSLRAAIEAKKIPSSLLTAAPAITIYDNHKKFCRDYLKCTTNKRILAYRNNVVDKYNKYINDPDNTFNIGDIVVIDKPIKSIGAHNKDILTIVDIREEEDYYNVRLVTDNGNQATVRHYKKVSELSRQLEELKTLNKENEYWILFNQSFRLKHIFASTVHAAQGETLDTVYIDAYDIIAAHQQTKTRYNKPISAEMMLRLLYVAISRMQTRCVIYTGVEPRDYSELQKDPSRKIRTTKKKVKEEKVRFTLDG